MLWCLISAYTDTNKLDAIPIQSPPYGFQTALEAVNQTGTQTTTPIPVAPIAGPKHTNHTSIPVTPAATPVPAAAPGDLGGHKHIIDVCTYVFQGTYTLILTFSSGKY
jgi:hypothetical protein